MAQVDIRISEHECENMFQLAASLKGRVLVMQHTEFVVYNLDNFTALNDTSKAPDPHKKKEKKKILQGQQNLLHGKIKIK